MRACERPGCRSSLQWSNSPSSPGSHCTGQAQPRKTESALGIATGRDLLLEIRLQNNQKGQRKTCQHPRRQSPQEPGRIVVVRSLSHVQLFATTWTAARQAPLSPTVSQSLLRFMSIESVMLNTSSLNILFSVAPFSSCLQSFPASGSFPMSWLFLSGGQSIGASISVLPVNIQG